MGLSKRVNCIVLVLLCKPNVYTTKATANFVRLQPGDVQITYAGSKALEDDYGFWPTNVRADLRH